MAAPSLCYSLAKMDMKMEVGQLADWTDVRWLEKSISGGRNEMKIASVSDFWKMFECLQTPL